jgi:signal transduction histidine kinase
MESTSLPDHQLGGVARLVRPPSPDWRQTLRALAIVIGGLAVLSILAAIVDQEVVNLHPAAAGWLYLLFVLPITLHWGRPIGLCAAVIAGTLDYVLFIEPRYTLTVQHPVDLYQWLLTVVSMLLTVAVVSYVNELRLTAVRRVAAQAEIVQTQHEHELLLATVAHDLRSPLTVVRGRIQRLQRHIAQGRALEPEQVERELAAIDAAAVAMVTYVADILDVAKLQAGKPLELRCQPVDLVALVRQAADNVSHGALQRAVTVEAIVAELTGSWDSARLARVVDNLLTNAIKYSPDGSAIEARLTTEDDRGATWAVLSVRDSGLGIPVEDLPHIFEPFRRGQNVANRIPGTGLGLAGARQIVAQHGGTIAVQSAQGVGTTMTVRLPLSD